MVYLYFYKTNAWNIIKQFQFEFSGFLTKVHRYLLETETFFNDGYLKIIPKLLFSDLVFFIFFRYCILSSCKRYNCIITCLLCIF